MAYYFIGEVPPMRCYLCNTTLPVNADAYPLVAVAVCYTCAPAATQAIDQSPACYTDPETGEVDMDAYWDEVERQERDALRDEPDHWQIAGEVFDDRMEMWLNEY